jgi:hypothetical protein
LIDVPARVERAAPAVPIVRAPLILRAVSLKDLRGQLLGPGDVPVPGVRVEVPAVAAGTYTDATGRFALSGLPAGALRLTLTGRGRHFHTDLPTATDEPVVIRCDFEEE